ncbi:unnamed protein product [Orchesella dallaii]|uniref:Uncharacterized protein n=1 Tax=Orchesella dallaii TaxID=48710 RepID=A0ABP1S6Y0_9HEXA
MSGITFNHDHAIGIVLLIFYCHISNTFGLVKVPHVGDFMEFHVGLHAACEDVTGGENYIREISSSFANCTNKVVENDPKDLFGSISAICKNRGEYFHCWDELKNEVLKKCGLDKKHMLPVLYRNTVFSFCGSDNGTYKLANMRTAFRKVQPATKNKCPKLAGTDWLENCKDSLTTFTATDLCRRHEAINECVWKITCDNFRGADLIRRMYSDGRSLLQCKE